MNITQNRYNLGNNLGIIDEYSEENVGGVLVSGDINIEKDRETKPTVAPRQPFFP